MTGYGISSRHIGGKVPFVEDFARLSIARGNWRAKVLRWSVCTSGPLCTSSNACEHGSDPSHIMEWKEITTCYIQQTASRADPDGA